MSTPIAVLEAGAERACQPADPGAEVERLPAASRPIERVGDGEDMRDLRLAGCEELVHVPAPALAPRPGQHRPERIDLGQAVPVLLMALEAHARSPYRRPTTSGSGRSSAPSARIQGCRSSGSSWLLDHEGEQVRLPREDAGDPRHDRPGEPQHGRAGAAVDLDERSGSSNSRKKRIRWRACGANEATVFSTSRSDQR